MVIKSIDTCESKKKFMTLPSNGKKLNQNEISSIISAIREGGIRQVHPDKMEAFADYLVEKFQNQK